MDEKVYTLNMTEEEFKAYYQLLNENLCNINKHNLELLSTWVPILANSASVEEQIQMYDYLVQIYDLSQKAGDLYEKTQENEKEKNCDRYSASEVQNILERALRS